MPKFLPNKLLDLAVRFAEHRQPAPAHSASASLVDIHHARTDPSLKETAQLESLPTLAATEEVDFFTNKPVPRTRQALRVGWEEIAERPRAVAVRFRAEPGALLEDVRPTSFRDPGINV